MCNQSFETPALLSSHIRHKHKVKSYDYSLKYEYNNEIHKCKCGCNEETKWININVGFNDFIKGHASRMQTKIERNKNVNSVILSLKLKLMKQDNFVQRNVFINIELK